MSAAHLTNLRQMPCCVCSVTPAGYAHHAVGGSMLAKVGMRGAAMRASDWLALPLCHGCHQGEQGIHTIGVRTWEAEFGDQAWHLERMGRKLDCDLFELAFAEMNERRAKRRYTPPTKQVPRNAA